MIIANVVRYYIGCRPVERGGWWVGTVVADEQGNESNGPKYQEDISTKKEAKALAANLNYQRIHAARKVAQ